LLFKQLLLLLLTAKIFTRFFPLNILALLLFGETHLLRPERHGTCVALRERETQIASG
jgi:hypothetical protein